MVLELFKIILKMYSSFLNYENGFKEFSPSHETVFTERKFIYKLRKCSNNISYPYWLTGLIWLVI